MPDGGEVEVNYVIFRIQIMRNNEWQKSFSSNRQRLKEGTFCASELAGTEPTPPAPEEHGTPQRAQTI
jgi:hypothetical protein